MAVAKAGWGHVWVVTKRLEGGWGLAEAVGGGAGRHFPAAHNVRSNSHH